MNNIEILKDAYAYVRISREDKNKDAYYSRSINNQIDYIRQYARFNNINIKKVYIDDGYSGMNFDRPAFNKLISDMKSDRVSAIITKDMSRLGRDYIGMNYYIYNLFKMNNIEYIAINDYIDDGKENDIHYMIRSVVNYKYIKDISDKIRKVKEIKTTEGSFLGYIAPYGYNRVKDNNRILLKIDSSVKNIIKEIFIYVALGIKLDKISSWLNRDKIESPSKHMKVPYNTCSKWNRTIIYRIIRNVVYLGNLEKRKSEKTNLFNKKRKYISIKERKVIEGVYEPIVNRVTFLEANKRIKNRNNKNRIINQNELERKFYCGKCGNNFKIIIRNRDNKEYIYYCCSKCKNKISKNVMQNILASTLKSEFSSRCEELIKFIDLMINNCNSKIDLKNNIIDKVSKSQALNLYINGVNKKSEILKIQNIQDKDREAFINYVLEDYINMASNYIEKVEVYKSVKIYFNFFT